MNKAFNQKVALNIKKYRKMRGLRQLDVAVDANIGLFTFALFESARSDITLAKFVAIAEALKVEPWQLLKFDE